MQQSIGDLADRGDHDDGVSWPREELLYRGDSAYSCLVVRPDGEALCVFEVDGYRRIVLTKLADMVRRQSL